MTGRGRVLVGVLVVFALAIGILAGSGPMRSLLRGAGGGASELEQAQADAAAAEEQAQLGRDFAEAAGATALRGTLDGHTVALIRTADVTDEDLAAASERIAATGGATGATVALTDEWTQEDRGPFRDALAEQITGALDNPPPGTTASQVLSSALAEALTAGGEFDAEGQERADTLWTLLTEAQLVSGTRDAAADLVLLVAPGGDVSDLAQAFGEQSVTTVVGFTDDDAGEAAAASTVTDAASFYGAWAVAATLVAAASGATGHHDSADAPGLIAALG